MLLIDRVPDAVIGRSISQRLAMAIRKIGKKNDAPVVFVGKQRIDTYNAQVESGTANRMGVLYLTCIAEFSAQHVLVLGLETKRNVFRTGPWFLAIQSKQSWACDRSCCLVRLAS
ncbi:hypothetical protein I6F21_27120 [Bradyrhizobium sp. NBAIM03]|uniref:hypothetical protein n=1 Tax=Bradyrhizobium sp. NBAIM03 TaxID=2793816 RepID=UPI001CD2DB17|nr:hypothetical protein [Bradyrhizobium sp. NBAIM03]MCA1536205.1 hypothetical protein [Bradyrhizobium sp. NBAIM03]